MKKGQTPRRKRKPRTPNTTAAGQGVEPAMEPGTELVPSAPAAEPELEWPGELTRLLHTVRRWIGTLLDAADAAAEALVGRSNSRS